MFQVTATVAYAAITCGVILFTFGPILATWAVVRFLRDVRAIRVALEREWTTTTTTEYVELRSSTNPRDVPPRSMSLSQFGR